MWGNVLLKYVSTNKFVKNVGNISSKDITPLLSRKHIKFSVGRIYKKIPRNNVIVSERLFNQRKMIRSFINTSNTPCNRKISFMWICRIMNISISIFMLSRLGNVNTNLILINVSQWHKIFFLSCYTYWSIHWPCFCFCLYWL